MNNVKSIMNTLTAMGANPAITIDIDGDIAIKVNAPGVIKFKYEQLSDDAKQEAKQWYINQYNYLERFKEDYEIQLKEYFADSDLKIALSWLCCQGDGVNVYGRVNLEDFIPHWDVSEKEKRTMVFYISKSLYYYDFTYNIRYSYSCKNIDINAIDYTVEDFTDALPPYLRDVNVDLIRRFYSDMFDFFDDLDGAIYDDLYKYIYDPDDNDIADYCDVNEIYFTAGGELI